MTGVQDLALKIKVNIAEVIIGKESAIELLLVALICEGHILLEDVPGVGKTMLARALAISICGTFKRLQCTPDLLPNDITGVSIFNQSSKEFFFRPGPVFVNILLADEINRATPRTQAALLEAMQEQQVTVDGISHPLPKPFIVMATQNPVEFEGTFPLPEAQLDRFMLQVTLGYPSTDEEKLILIKLSKEHPINNIKDIIDLQEIVNLREEIWNVHVDETIQDYIIALIHATRINPDITLGASPRATLALFKGCQALAALRGRDHVIPDDVKYLFIPTISHRLMIRPESALRGKDSKSLLKDILDSVPIPLET
jgi:MoxR-like ATPase